ncbi:MAG: serine acetyltransferase, partial [Pseudomonadota bacterium]
MFDYASEAAMIREVGLWRVIKEDFIANGRNITRPGFSALFIHRLGVWSRALPRLLRFPFSVFHWIGHFFVRNFYGIELELTVQVGRRMVI